MAAKYVAYLERIFSVCIFLQVGTECSQENVDTSFSELLLKIDTNRKFISISYKVIPKLQGSALTKFSNLQAIYLTNNKIQTISSEVFHNLAELHHLDLSFNNISALERKTFHGLQQLKYLDMTNNNITHLPEGVFANLPQLEKLCLRNNRISKICEGAFWNLPALQYLFLSGNKLQHLSESAFEDLPSLKSLQLDNNHLTHLIGPAFENLTALENINLNGNQLLSFSAEAFQECFTLRSLNLSGNKLSELVHRIFEDLLNLEELFLSFNHIKKFGGKPFYNLQNLKSLYLNNNDITDLPEKVFQTLHEVRYIHLQKNLITEVFISVFRNLTNLDVVYFQSNGLSEWNKSRTVSFVRTLQLGRNSLSTLPSEMFLQVPCLKCLNLSHNSLSNISRIFPNTTLESLILNHNEITNIPEGTFTNMTKLQFIEIQFNKISHVSKGAFRQVPKLFTIYLQGNRLSQTSVEVFHFHLLREHYPPKFISKYLVAKDVCRVFAKRLLLKTSSNHVCDIEMFKSFGVINLDGNIISKIYPGTFYSLHYLRTLSLQRNQMSFIHSRAFSFLPHLGFLFLSDNRLSEIQPGTFQNLLCLIKLSLRNNRLTVISEGMFKGLLSLQSLELDGNYLSTLEGGSFNYFTSLEFWRNRKIFLSLGNNPLSRIPLNVYSKNSTFFLEEKNLKPLKQIFINLTKTNLSCSTKHCWINQINVKKKKDSRLTKFARTKVFDHDCEHKLGENCHESGQTNTMNFWHENSFLSSVDKNVSVRQSNSTFRKNLKGFSRWVPSTAKSSTATAKVKSTSILKSVKLGPNHFLMSTAKLKSLQWKTLIEIIYISIHDVDCWVAVMPTWKETCSQRQKVAVDIKNTWRRHQREKALTVSILFHISVLMSLEIKHCFSPHREVFKDTKRLLAEMSWRRLRCQQHFYLSRSGRMPFFLCLSMWMSWFQTFRMSEKMQKARKISSNDCHISNMLHMWMSLWKDQL